MPPPAQPTTARKRPRALGCLASAIALAAAHGVAQIPQHAIPLERVAEQDPVATRHSFVELVTERETWYLGEPVPVRIRVGIEQEFQSDLLPLFRRELSLPLQVLAPWLDTLPLCAPSTPHETAGASLVLNDEVTHVRPVAQQTRGELNFIVYEVTRVLQPDRTGALDLSGNSLRLA
ncbi:MAG: hypothetical protein ACI8QZ_004308, partial [Chlamydiales bacterium]